MQHTVFTHTSLTAWLLLASFATAAAPTTTSIQAPLAGTVFVPLNDGSSDAVALSGRVNVVEQRLPGDPYRYTFALNGVSGIGETTGLRYTATGTNRVIPTDPIEPIRLGFVLRHARTLPGEPTIHTEPYSHHWILLFSWSSIRTQAH